MEHSMWKTIGVEHDGLFYCGNCGNLVEGLRYDEQLDECIYCHWLIVYPQSTRPTTTTNEI